MLEGIFPTRICHQVLHLTAGFFLEKASEISFGY